LAVTNTFEGALFIDSNTASTVQVPLYLSRLFPNFGAKEIEAAAAQYSGLGSPIFQVTAIMGEGMKLPFCLNGYSHSYAPNSDIYLPDLFPPPCI
jgi:hypothetical protein